MPSIDDAPVSRLGAGSGRLVAVFASNTWDEGKNSPGLGRQSRWVPRQRGTWGPRVIEHQRGHRLWNRFNGLKPASKPTHTTTKLKISRGVHYNVRGISLRCRASLLLQSARYRRSQRRLSGASYYAASRLLPAEHVCESQPQVLWQGLCLCFGQSPVRNEPRSLGIVESFIVHVGIIVLVTAFLSGLDPSEGRLARDRSPASAVVGTP